MSLTATLQSVNRLLDALRSPLLLGFRLYVGWVFFHSGWLKISNWEQTLTLFEYEYNVPLLPWELAAYLGTAGELIFPLFLFAGLATRYAAIGLSFVNVMAVIAYHDTLVKYGQLIGHEFWGSLLLVLVAFGGGFLSIDHWIGKRMRDQGTR
jgi:putative oxidoreductase